MVVGVAAPFAGRREPFPKSPTIKGRIGVRIEGDTALLLNLDRLKQLPKEGATRALQIMASEFLATLTALAPRDTGRYINSWRIKENSPGKIVIGPVGMLPPRETITGGQADPVSAQKLATMLEFTGSPAHPILPKNANALVYLHGGEVKFSKRVSHPGFKPIPHIRPALNQVRRNAKGIVWAVATEYAGVKEWKESFTKAARTNGYDGGIPPRQTGRNRADTSANIGRGTKAQFGQKLSVGLSGKRIRRRGLTRIVGSSESNLKAVRKSGQRLKGQGIERFRSVGLYSQ